MNTNLIAGNFVKTADGNSGIVIEIKTRGWVAVSLATGEIRNFQARTLVIDEPEMEITEAEAEEILEPAVSSILTALINFKGEEAKKEPAAPYNLDICPKCGSSELYSGHIDKNGFVVDEQLVGGCHHCDWTYDVRTDRKNGIVKSCYLDRYTKVSTVRNGEKVRSLDNNDAVAKALRTLDSLDDVYEYVASQIKEDIDALHARYDHLNNGQQRMNLGNRLRSYYRRMAESAA